MASPSSSRPMNIRSPGTPSTHQGSHSGTPHLNLLRAQYTSSGTPPPNIPLRGPTAPFPERSSTSQINLLSPPGNGSPRPANSSSSVTGGISAARPSSSNGSGPSTPGAGPSGVTLEELPEEEKMRILRRHLVSKEERKDNNADGNGSDQDNNALVRKSSNLSAASVASSSSSQAMARLAESEMFPVPYHTPGADVTHDIYKYQSKQRQQARPRAASFTTQYSSTTNPAFEHIHEPGGFRRNYVLLRNGPEGSGEDPQMLNNFVDFLYLYGHFAGEDLEEEEEEKSDEDLEQATRPGPSHLATGLPDAGEDSPLLGGGKATSRSRSAMRRRASSVGPHGNATVTQAVLMLLKAFIGTGVLFLGRAFYNGGLLFSSLLFVFIAMVSLFSFLLLSEAKLVLPGSFGDMGGALYGPWFRNLILVSIVISQIGFCSAYIIFVSENLQAFVMGVTHCAQVIGVQWFILIQAIIFMPIVLVRDLAKLSSTALVADLFILIGLVYIFGSEIKIVAGRGIADVQMFNPKDFSLFVGTAVFSFEGIGLVIPITDAMKEPRKFPKALTGVMIFLTILFGGAGALAYMTFGSSVQTVILVNLDTSSKAVQTVQFLYSCAILLSVPLQLFPAIRILENGLFTRSGKGDNRVKWTKNIFRWIMICVAGCISWAGAADLDKFVAFIGCFACVPLCYVYPAMLHIKACATTRSEKIKDWLMIVFGLIAAAYTTVQTIKLMLEPDTGSPQFGSCDPPVQGVPGLY